MTKSKKVFWLIYLFGFFWAFAGALPAYIQSSYLEQFTGIRFVGLYWTLSMVVTLFAIYFFPRVIRHFGNYRVTLVVLWTLFFSALVLSQSTNRWVALAAFVFYVVPLDLLAINSDIFLKHITGVGATGRVRTIFLTFINIAWLCAPFLMGHIAASESYAPVYLVAAAAVIPAILIIMSQRTALRDGTHYQSRHWRDLLQIFKSNHNLSKIFQVAFFLNFFYCVMVLYTPIYLHQYLGFSWTEIGVMFTVMLLPFVALEFPAGSLADRYWGEQEILVVGLLIMAVSTGAIFFIQSSHFIVWTVILAMTRIGAALVEAMQDVYFFKNVRKQDMDLIDLFRDIRPAAWLCGSLFSVIVLEFFAIHYLYLFLAALLFFGLRAALTLKDTK